MEKERFYYKNVMVKIFRDHWDSYKRFHPEKISEDIEENVEKMMGCGEIENGYFEYICPECHETKKVGFSCKSRFCLRCSKVYIDNWVNRMRETVFKWINHRHIILTIPGSLWDYFRGGHLLDELINCGARTIREAMELSNNKRKIEPGMIGIIQTSGRASTWNPHLHFLVTEGGLGENGKWQDLAYIDYEILRKKWMYNLLSMLRGEMKGNPVVSNKIEEIYRKRWDKGLIVRAKRERIRKKNIVVYLIKYVASPPIALSRITKYDGENVTYWYREHPTDKEVEVTVNAFEFIKRMIQHIMPKQLKLIRHYGLYARNKVRKVRQLLEKIFKGIRDVTQDFKTFLEKTIAPSGYRERIKRAFGRDPLKCPKCGSELMLWSIWHPRYGYIYDAVRDAPEVIEEGDNVVEKEEKISARQLAFEW